MNIPNYWLPTVAETRSARRILIAKAGLDGHDRGAKYVAHVLRDAGYEVAYTGIRRTPEQIVEAAIEKHCDAVGVSILSGAHKALFAQILQLLCERKSANIALFGGGVIPHEDAAYLKSIGVREVFTPGTPAAHIVRAIDMHLQSTV